MAVGHDDDGVVLRFAALPVAVCEDGARVGGCGGVAGVYVGGYRAGGRVGDFDCAGRRGGPGGCCGARCWSRKRRNEVDFAKGGENLFISED